MTSKKEAAYWEAIAAKWQEEAEKQLREKIDAVVELELQRDYYKDWAKNYELWWKKAEGEVGTLKNKNRELRGQQLAEEESDRD